MKENNGLTPKQLEALTNYLDTQIYVHESITNQSINEYNRQKVFEVVLAKLNHIINEA